MAPLIRFTPEEGRLIQDTHFFRTKAAVTVKVKEILRGLHAEIAQELAISKLLAPEGVDLAQGQLVKGEHLLDFPYLYLDFPKLFTQAEKFAFRSLFWWGHFFVFALILEGRHLDRYKSNLLEAYDRVAEGGFSLLLTETPWEWREDPQFLLEIRTDNRRAVASALAFRPFLKIHRYFHFSDPELLEGRIVQAGGETFRLLKPIVTEPA